MTRSYHGPKSNKKCTRQVIHTICSLRSIMCNVRSVMRSNHLRGHSCHKAIRLKAVCFNVCEISWHPRWKNCWVMQNIQLYCILFKQSKLSFFKMTLFSCSHISHLQLQEGNSCSDKQCEPKKKKKNISMCLKFTKDHFDVPQGHWHNIRRTKLRWMLEGHCGLGLFVASGLE